MGIFAASLRFIVADFFMFINVSLGTPYYVARIILTSTKSRNGPSILHRYLNAVIRTLIWWETLLSAQNTLFSKRELQKKKDTHVFIKPSPVGRSSSSSGSQDAFNDDILPVQLTEKDKNEMTRAIWYYDPASKAAKPTQVNKARDVPVMLYFHGGAFIRFTADHFLYRPMLSMLAKEAGVDVLAISHRLAPGSKFPNHLFEAYSAFVYLRSLGYNKIILGGDSGGANIALQLHHYLLKQTSNMHEHIAGIFMVCAWLDLSDGHELEANKYAPEDQIPLALLQKGARSLLTNGLPDLNNKWLSPFAWMDDDPSLLTALPPIYAITGEIEVLYPENMEFAEGVRKAKQGKADYTQVIADAGVHNFVIQPWAASRTRVYFKDAAPWVKRVTA